MGLAALRARPELFSAGYKHNVKKGDITSTQSKQAFAMVFRRRNHRNMSKITGFVIKL